jgi:hypothetical protein
VDPAAADGCHHLAVRDGERAGGWQLGHVLAAWFLVIGALIGSAGVIEDLFLKDLSTGEREWRQALPSALFTVVWLTFMVRLMRMGIYVSDEGVRIRTVPRTVTYPWAEITTAGARGDDLWLVLTDGREVKTPVRRVERRSGHRRNGIPLNPGDFNLMLHQLQRHVQPGR